MKNGVLIFLIIGALVVTAFTAKAQNPVNNMSVDLITYLGDRRYPRGIRNNNPGNIRRGSDPWQGRIPWTESTDKEFEQFQKFWYGVRAMTIIVKNYFSKYKLNTVSKIINRWAPPIENDTQAYIRAVVTITGFKADQVLTPDKETLRRLVYAISDHENGFKDQISDELFDYAYSKI